MARTIRKTTGRDGRIDYSAPGVRPYWSRERKWARKSTNRKNRNRTDEVLRTITDPEDVMVDRPVSTGGWISH